MNKCDFIIRVYGIHINKYGKILLADEEYKGIAFCKFPGGGIEKGESTIDCLKREFKEELDLNIEIVEHFYTTDFYQESAFDKSQQIFSIYYIVKDPNEMAIQKVDKANSDRLNKIHFKWIEWNDLKVDDLTFPIDKKVAEILIKKRHLNDA